MTHAANVFLLEVNPQSLLEEQTDACKRVLNIYRYMVMNTRMDNGTWYIKLFTYLILCLICVILCSPQFFPIIILFVFFCIGFHVNFLRVSNLSAHTSTQYIVSEKKFIYINFFHSLVPSSVLSFS